MVLLAQRLQWHCIVRKGKFACIIGYVKLVVSMELREIMSGSRAERGKALDSTWSEACAEALVVAAQLALCGAQLRGSYGSAVGAVYGIDQVMCLVHDEHIAADMHPKCRPRILRRG